MIQSPTVFKGLHGSPSLTMFSLIGSLVIVIIHEYIEVDLDFFNRFVDFFPEGDLVEFILNDLVQPLG